MKKILSLLLCLCLLLSCSAMGVNATENELIIDVANDLHYSYTSNEGFTVTPDDADPFAHVSSSGQLYVESKAIITAFLEKAAADESSAVLLVGDITDGGRDTEHKALAKMLAEFEKTSGKEVYVVPGNHDFSNNRTSVAQFMEYYADFGYNQAIALDPSSASYVAELSDDYRLLAIDSTIPGEGGYGLDAQRIEWIRQQAEKAKQDGKKMIAMLHHNMLTHLVLANVLIADSVVDYSLGLREIFAEYGVKYTFTGHTHEHDVASYKGSNGEVIYEAVTGTLNAYPLPYRTAYFGSEVKLETRYITEIDTSLVKGQLSNEAQSLMETDLTEYSRVCVFKGVEKSIYNFISVSKLKSLLGITEESDPEMCALIKKLIPLVKEGLSMPFYKQDEVTEGLSIESILEEYNITIPSSNYENMAKLAVTIYEEHVAGDENLPAYSTEIVLASKGIGALLIHTLKDVTAEEYAQVLTFVCKLLGADVPANLINYAGDGISRFEGIELVVSTAILPLMLKVTVDDAPADCNVTLPGYSELIETEKELTVWEKIENFFIKIFSFIMSLFAFI